MAERGSTGGRLCPYVGLVPFKPADERFFFGRKRETRQVINNLFAARLTLLYGPSGVGKSSLLGAGVLAELGRRAEGRAARRVAVYLNEWHGDALTALRRKTLAALRRALPQATVPEPQGVSHPSPSGTLSDWLTEVTTRLGVELLVIFDQFEEYFVYHEEPGPEVRDPFALQLAEVVRRVELPVSLLLGLRDDALARLDRFEALIPDLFENYLRLEPLSDAAAEEAIVRPLEVWNLERVAREQVALAPGLADHVVAQVRRGEEGVGGRGRPAGERAGIQAPLLQLVMERLWKQDAASRQLEVATLEKTLGGAEGIAEVHLEEVMAGLSDKQRAICGRMFEYLVTPSGAKIAHSARDLARYSKVAVSELQVLLTKIAGSKRRVLASVAPLVAQGEVLYEIYHDALGRAVLHWQRRWAAARERAKTRRLWLAVAAFAMIAALAVWAMLVARSESRRAEESARQAEESARQAAEKEKEATDLAKDVRAANAAGAEQERQRKEAELQLLEEQGKAEDAARVRLELADAREQQEALARRFESLGSDLGVAAGGDGLEEVVAGLKAERAALARQLADLASALDAGEGEDLVAVAADRMTTIAAQRTRAGQAEGQLEKARKREAELLTEEAVDMRFRRISKGVFRMGSPETEEGRYGDETLHTVTLTRDFWMAETEVTQGQWRKLMPSNPSLFSSCGDDCPVEQVSWYGAVTFANRLSEAAKLPLCYDLKGCRGTVGIDHACESVELAQGCSGYRLPTEAEWEYAARAGTTTATYGGDLSISGTRAPELEEIAWYFGNSSGVTRPVRGKRANPWGLHDMLGNVREWVEDAADWREMSSETGRAYRPDGGVSTTTYVDGSEDPLSTRGSSRVLRGGSWLSRARYCRSAYRYGFAPGLRRAPFGFRLVRTSE